MLSDTLKDPLAIIVEESLFVLVSVVAGHSCQHCLLCCMCTCECACTHTCLRKPFPRGLKLDFCTVTRKYVFGYDVRMGFNFFFFIRIIDRLSTIKYSNLFPADLFTTSQTYPVSIRMDSCCFLGSVPSKSHWASPSSLSLQSYTLFRDEDCSLTMCQLLPYRTVWPGRLSVIWLRPTPWTHPCLSSSSLHLYAPTACTVPFCAFASAIPWGCEAHSILSTQQICVLPLKAGDNCKAFSFSLRKKTEVLSSLCTPHCCTGIVTLTGYNWPLFLAPY